MAIRRFIWTEQELLAAYLFPTDGRRWLMRKLCDELGGTNSDLRLLDEGRLDLTLPKGWKDEGLFGKIGDRRSTVRKSGLGRGKGMKTRYSRAALDRLHYIVNGARASLGPKRIKSALRFGVPLDELGVCGDLQTWRYALTKPLALLLNGEIDTDNPDRLHELYEWIWRWTPEADGQISRLRKKSPTASQGELDDDFERGFQARDAFPLSLLLRPPEREPVTDFYFAGVTAAQETVEAMRRIVKNPRGAPAADWQIVKKYAVKKYDVRIQASGPRHTVYKGDIDEPRRPMTLLKQAASHLVVIQNEVRKWIGVCRRYRPEGGRCGRFFALADPKQETCKDRFCQSYNSATPT